MQPFFLLLKASKHLTAIRGYYEELEAPEGKTLIVFEESANPLCLLHPEAFLRRWLAFFPATDKNTPH